MRYFLAGLFTVFMVSCTGVPADATVRNVADPVSGHPMPLLVTVASATQAPEVAPARGDVGFSWESLGTLATVLLGGGGVLHGLMQTAMANKAKTALKITADLADALEKAPDASAVNDAKRVAEQAQVAAGVKELTNQVRGA